MLGNEDELNQLFQNLIDNAVKYGRPKTEVRVTARRGKMPGPSGRRGPASRSRSADEGEGIAREDLPRLTERFYRVDKARSRALGGTGLGLAIVKHIVNRHRGRLTIDSEPGRGSTFTIQLPAAGAQAGKRGLRPVGGRIAAYVSKTAWPNGEFPAGLSKNCNRPVVIPSSRV